MHYIFIIGIRKYFKKKSAIRELKKVSKSLYLYENFSSVADILLRQNIETSLEPLSIKATISEKTSATANTHRPERLQSDSTGTFTISFFPNERRLEIIYKNTDEEGSYDFFKISLSRIVEGQFDVWYACEIKAEGKSYNANHHANQSWPREESECRNVIKWLLDQQRLS